MKQAHFALRRARRTLSQGGVVAYPTEAVYGLGCDPLDDDAVGRLLEMKGRPVHKGLILIAAEFSQLLPFIESPCADGLQLLRESWPGPVTWVVAARPELPFWLRGNHATVAVRVTGHPLAAALCRAFGGALVSTSANPAGLPPARSPLAVRRYFGEQVNQILHGATGGLRKPTEIRSLADGRVLRPA
ncbi:MAG TPA: tRNA threonylcarbamoyladenosine biosynthesis protein RimN [Gammaproteobacteria bacterium]|nr:tRNA threonylcarbamoyladenosine biosynthesis protein RimN [Gammaproteobacteria bacterium]